MLKKSAMPLSKATAAQPSVKRNCPPEEWHARVDLACAYRVFHHLGWHNLIYNHITLRIPGPERNFLINPFGLLYEEVTASNLVKVDLEGNKIDASSHDIAQAGYVVHSSVHRYREDVMCVMHTHTNAGVAVACQPGGLLPLDIQSSIFAGKITYHDLEGVTLETSESDRIARNLGDSNTMILRNHGLLACGPTVAETFHELHLLEKCCQVQLAIQSSGVPPIPIPPEVQRKIAAQSDMRNSPRLKKNAKLQWAAMRRRMDALDPTYAN